MKLLILLFSGLIIFPVTVFTSGQPVQSIRGQVIEKITRQPLPGATIVQNNSTVPVGTISDNEGYFVLKEVPVGRADLTISFLGYQSVVLNNLMVNAGKELVLLIEMEESTLEVGEVIVESSKKYLTNNELATVSARTFTIEESQRYAGSRQDVARMASNYAGVGTANDAENSIVVRGNAPDGLLWMLEGVPVPNPNHYGFVGGTGGPVSMLNNYTLANSDFFTSAFPAEYGNALSGVFDLKMRNGNYNKHEFMAQAGFMGLELGAEGPINRQSKATYLVNYRYSTLGIMKAIGINFGTGTAVPEYQDASFKINLPVGQKGKFTLFGLGGTSYIEFLKSKIDTAKADENLYNEDNTDVYSKNRMATGGASYTWFVSSSTWTRLTLSASHMQNKGMVDSVSYTDRSIHAFERQKLVENNEIADWFLYKKLNARHHFKLGATVKIIQVSLLDSILTSPGKGFRDQVNVDGQLALWQAYTQWQYKLTNQLVWNLGGHFQYLGLNGSKSLEPRTGLKWQITSRQALNVGYGLHSKTQMLLAYFWKTQYADGSYAETNREMKFTRSHQFVLGHDWVPADHWRIKSEVYYQYLFDVPVEHQPSSFSMLNFSPINFNIEDSLVNKGTGTNYGLELTIERFLNNNWYMLFTTSLYDSKYKGSNKQERSTAFDGGYVFNLLAGKDFELKSTKNHARRYFVVDLKSTLSGGLRYTPIDRSQSILEQQTVYDDRQAFTRQFGPYFRTDLRIGYRKESIRVSQEVSIDIMNVTNHQNPLYMRYNVRTDEENFVYQIGFFPVLQYKVMF